MLTVRADVPPSLAVVDFGPPLTDYAFRRWLASLDTCLSTARCPRCRGALVARLGRAGPYFHCLCPESRK